MGGKGKQPAPQASNVRVVARIRPLAKYELANGSKQIVNSLPSISSSLGGPIQIPTEPEVLEVKPEGAEKRWFELDAVLDGTSTQEEAYIKSGAQQAVTQDLFKGFNCTILAYGQTGAGTFFLLLSSLVAVLYFIVVTGIHCNVRSLAWSVRAPNVHQKSFFLSY